MSEAFGFAKRDPAACSHAGMWEVATIAGYGVMLCTGCGYSFFLKKVEGDLFWQEAYRVTAEELREASERAIYAGGDEKEEAA